VTLPGCDERKRNIAAKSYHEPTNSQNKVMEYMVQYKPDGFPYTSVLDQGLNANICLEDAEDNSEASIESATPTPTTTTPATLAAR
jgi:hypothetical protein